MVNALQQFGARDTGSFERRFHTSIWKLTLVYMGVLAAILVVSSGVIYSAFSSRLEDRYRDFRPSVFIVPDGIVVRQPPTREDVQHDLIASLILVNGILLILAGIVSYFLARLTLQPLKDAYERQQRFLADASHELRTPLSILRIDLENEARDAILSSRERDRAKSHLEEVERMSSLVSDLLALSRMQEEKPSNGDAAPEELEVMSFVRGITDRLSGLAKEHGVTLKFSADSESITGTLRKNLLDQAVANVVKNAIVYNKSQGSVDVRVQEVDGEVMIEVADTGIGIAPEEVPNVFERFYRSDKSRSRATGGNGLGLAIVRSSIDQLGGTIDIKSEVDKGTVVVIKVPLHI